MTAFADASAVVKLYVTEPGSATIRRRTDPLVISALSRVEVVSSLWRKHRTGELSATDSQLLTQAFEYEIAQGRTATGAAIATVALTSRMLDRAAQHCAVHGLKAADSLQLAGAQFVRAADPGCSTFLVFDERLARAAALEGFSVVGV